jgi:arylsulfatase
MTASMVLLATLTLGAPPNIVLVMTDDQGYGDITAHGNPVLKTPNLDKLHSQSVRFTDFHVSPTCAPTRSALMTGRHEFKNGITHTIFERERLTLKAVTLPQILKQVGYTSGIFGKWHLGDEPEYLPNRRGFDEMFIHGGGGIGQTFPGSCGDAPDNSYFNPAILHNDKFVKTNGYCTDVFFKQAIGWMDGRRKSGKPFFAYITPNAPHAPLDCPPEYENKYKGKVPPDSAKFFGMVENIDDNMGRLMAALDEWGIAADTLLIFMTDNGGTAGVKVFNAGMRAQKGTPYMGGTRVPAFWRWPKGINGTRDVGSLTAHLDILPTLAEITGAKIPENAKSQVEGRSMVPLLKDSKAPWADRVLFTHVGRWPNGMSADSKYSQVSARNNQYNLVNNVRQGEKWELFDVRQDPGEKNNLAESKPEVVKMLKSEIDQWWIQVAPMLVNEQVKGPKVNPFKEMYWKQFGGQPDARLLEKMNPEKKFKNELK